MVQLSGPLPRPPMSSGSSSPGLTSPPPPQPPYIIPTGSVLSGMTQQGAPVLLVAVPYPAPSVRSEDHAVHMASLPGTSRHRMASGALMEEEKPLDLSVKASRSSPDAASSPRKTSAVCPPSVREQANQSAVIDLSSVTQSSLRPPPQVEQLNECKKCDIVFNKYESLLAHKQYYCASRHLRGRQIEMRYRQNVSPGRQSSSPGAHSDEGNRTESSMAQSEFNKPHSPIESDLNKYRDIAGTSSSKILDSNENQGEPSVIIKQKKEETLSGKDSVTDPNICTNSPTSSSQKSDNDRSVDDKIGKVFNQQDLKQTELKKGESKMAAAQATERSDTVEMCKLSTSSVTCVDGNVSDKEQRNTRDNIADNKSLSPVRSLGAVSRSQAAILELSKHIQRPFSCQACTVSFMKLESLEVHQKFYCAARNVDNYPHSSVDVRIPQTLPADGRHIADQGNDVINSDTSGKSEQPQRDSLFCKGCGQYFATSKQVRCHSCKNVTNQGGLIKHSMASLKRGSQEESGIHRANIVGDTGPPHKRCKNDSVIKVVPDVNKEQTNGVIVKQEIVENTECDKPTSNN